MERKHFVELSLLILTSIIIRSRGQEYPSPYVPIPHIPRPTVLSSVEYFTYSTNIDHVPSSYRQKRYNLQRLSSQTSMAMTYPTTASVSSMIEENLFGDRSRLPRMTPLSLVPEFGAAENNLVTSSPTSSECALVLRRTFVKKLSGRTPAPKYSDLFKQPFNK